jgi:serine/threonine protein phosphatase PrpC
VTTGSRPFEAARTTFTGNRACNQDRCLVLADGDCVLLAVADGLGGHPRGEVAAQLLVDVCEALFRRAVRPLADPQQFLLSCVGKAHQAIRRYGARQEPPMQPRTTAVLALVQNGVAHWAHVGDSRLYLLRDGQVMAQTRDHIQVRFVRQGGDGPSRALASLTRCLGGLPLPPVTTCAPATPLRPGDTLVLCSDGLWGQVPSAMLRDAFSRIRQPLHQCLEGLALEAVEAENSDNVSAVALRWLADPDADGATADRPGSVAQERAAPGGQPGESIQT